MTTKLSSFEGQDVLGATIAITNAGDGLSKAMEVAPEEFHLGDTIHVVLECEVSKVRYEPVSGTDGLKRVHTLRAGLATIVDADVVREQLERQSAVIDAAEGKVKLGDVKDCVHCDSSIAWVPAEEVWRDGSGSDECGDSPSGAHEPKGDEAE